MARPRTANKPVPAPRRIQRGDMVRIALLNASPYMVVDRDGQYGDEVRCVWIDQAGFWTPKSQDPKYMHASARERYLDAKVEATR